tara:strand:+ start:346 stop:612 length:267 start_codon:yes stop_codon:yes gene_type:complete
MNKDKLKEVAGELENASKMHAEQAKKIKSMLKMKKSGPFKMKSPLKGKKGLWDNIHAKRKRIKAGSGEKMRSPGDPGAPSAKDLRDSQ